MILAYVEKDEFKHWAIVPFLNVLWNTFSNFCKHTTIDWLHNQERVELTFP